MVFQGRKIFNGCESTRSFYGEMFEVTPKQYGIFV
jgi:hypothetical protein